MNVNKDVSYLAGVIIGDGHISNSYKSSKSKYFDYRIVIDVSDYVFLKTIEKNNQIFYKNKN